MNMLEIKYKYKEKIYCLWACNDNFIYFQESPFSELTQNCYVSTLEHIFDGKYSDALNSINIVLALSPQNKIAIELRKIINSKIALPYSIGSGLGSFVAFFIIGLYLNFFSAINFDLYKIFFTSLSLGLITGLLMHSVFKFQIAEIFLINSNLSFKNRILKSCVITGIFVIISLGIIYLLTKLITYVFSILLKAIKQINF